MRILRALYIVFLSICSTISYAQDIKEIGHLEFSDTLFNFGAVKEEDGVLSHSFQFVNLGPEYFYIEDVDPSCGCITPEYPTDTLHAGEQGKITLYFDPINHPGLFDRKVTIKGNASKTPFYLYISGYVTPSPQPLPEWERTSSFKYETIFIQKNYANFGVVSTRDIYNIEIPIYNNGASAISLGIEDVKLPAYLKVSLLPVKLEPKQKGMIKIMFNPKLVNRPGQFAEQVELLFMASNKKIIVPVVINAFIKETFTPAETVSLTVPKIHVEKTILDLGTIKTDEKTSAEISIMNSGTTELIIRGIRTSCSCVEAFSEKNTLKPGASTKIKIVFDATDRLGAENKVISIFSNDPVHSISTVVLNANVVETMPASPAQGQ